MARLQRVLHKPHNEGYAKLPMKMIKKLSDLRRHAADGTASEGFA